MDASGVKKPAPAAIGGDGCEETSPGGHRDDGRGWFRTSPEGEWCEETSPGGHRDDGRGWFRTSPEGEWCEETSPGGHRDDGRGWFRTSDLSRVKSVQAA